MYGKTPEITGAALGGARRSNAEYADQAQFGLAQQIEAQQSQLARTNERLCLCIEELDGLVAKLESALDPVLNPPSPANATGSASAPVPVRCPLGMSMDARSDEVCEISARVRTLLDRLAC